MGSPRLNDVTNERFPYTNLLIILKTCPPSLALLAALICFGFFTPGIASNDTIAILDEASSGLYANHHPPLNALFYKFCQLFKEGTSLVLAAHLSLLWLSVYKFMRLCSKPWVRLMFLLTGFYPPLLIYGVHIWKDVSFTFAYLFIFSQLLEQIYAPDKKISYKKFSCLLALLLVATALKYQAIFVLPWLLSLLIISKFRIDHQVASIVSLIASLIIYQGIQGFNRSISHQPMASQSWQYLRLYDLSGMSVLAGRDLIPNFCKTEYYSFASLQDLYNNQIAYFKNRLVDYFLIDNNPRGLLQKARTPDQQEVLETTWRHNITHLPKAYLMHRATIWWEILITPYFKRVPEKWLMQHHYPVALALPLRFFCYLPVFIASLILLGMSLYHKNQDYLVVFYLNGMSLSLVLISFFFTLAGPPRYTFFSLVMSLFSLPFALKQARL